MFAGILEAMRELLSEVVRWCRKVAVLLGQTMRRWPLVWAIGGAVLMLVVGVQLAYPADRSLPFARLNGDVVGSLDANAITAKLKQDYATMPLTVSIEGKKYETTASEAGIRTNEQVVIAGLTNYPLWQRLIPFSLLAGGLTKDQAVVVGLDDTRAELYAKARSADCAVAPKNAGVIVRDDAVQLDPARDGQSCPVSFIKKALAGVTLQKGGVVVTLKPAIVRPERTNEEVANVLTKAQLVIDRRLTLSLAGAEQSVPKKVIAAWLTFPQDEKTKDIRVEIDADQVREYLGTVQSSVYIAPGVTNIYTTDGVETNRVAGSEGRGIDTAATAAAIQQKLAEGDGTVQAKLTTIAPKTAYVRTYTPTQAGLQVLVAELAKDKGDYAISLRAMNGSFSAGANESKQYHPASTYKMYVGWAIIKRIAAGQMQWTDTAINGKNVSQCFDVMIINSDNACGEWLGEQVGWKNLNSMLKGLGLACTNLGSAWYSCAADESLFLYKLQAGQLLPADQADRLISVMKKQVYRSGIPAGVGVTVADKVGFLDGKLHDAAIVYGPRSTYVLTIMTSGSSWGQIADAARQIQAQLARMGF